MEFESARTKTLREVWTYSEAFNRCHGMVWRAPPCSACPLREVDYGGCRCQAAVLTGEAGAADPVCKLAPDHGIVPVEAIGAETAESGPAWQYRQKPATGRSAG